MTRACVCVAVACACPLRSVGAVVSCLWAGSFFLCCSLCLLSCIVLLLLALLLLTLPPALVSWVVFVFPFGRVSLGVSEFFRFSDFLRCSGQSCESTFALHLRDAKVFVQLVGTSHSRSDEYVCCLGPSSKLLQVSTSPCSSQHATAAASRRRADSSDRQARQFPQRDLRGGESAWGSLGTLGNLEVTEWETFSLMEELATALCARLHCDDVGLAKEEPDRVAVAKVLAGLESAQERTNTQRTEQAEEWSVGLPATSWRCGWAESPAANLQPGQVLKGVSAPSQVVPGDDEEFLTESLAQVTSQVEDAQQTDKATQADVVQQGSKAVIQMR